MSRLIASALLTLLAGTAGCSRAGDFSLQVDEAGGGAQLAQRFSYDRDGCTGRNLAPSLHWQGAPAGTRSFAISVIDPDAPMAGGFRHWFVLDLPADTHQLAEGGALPAGAYALQNDFGQPGWGGPCPPAGDSAHHYVFTVYALDAPHVRVSPEAGSAAAQAAVQEHVLGRAQQTLLFQR